MNLLIYADETGDLGLDFKNKKPSTHFCITMLVCKNKDTFVNIKKAVKKTRGRKLFSKKNKATQNELKGYNTDFKIKKYFFDQLSSSSIDHQQFEIYTMIIDKTRILPLIRDIKNTHRLYNTIARDLLEIIDLSNVGQVSLLMDKCKGSKEQGVFDKYIMDYLSSKLPLNIRIEITHELSENIEGLQAVDLFCHGIIRKYSENDTLWYDYFSKKIVEEVLWEPKI